MKECIFCNIVKGDIPSTKVFENQNVYAFKDLNPLAKEHLLFIHKKHTADINEMTENHPDQIAEIFKAIKEYTITNRIDENGFRVVTNVGPDAGQTVFHTHFHVLFGERLGQFGS
jgi:histidine triad (HIT) family protein